MLVSRRITSTTKNKPFSHMSRRSHTNPPSIRPTKRVKIDPNTRRRMTSDDFKNGLFLAPMVRSGALPTRLSALKHGATLVWGPEMVDKAILHAERVVDPSTGVVSYNGKTRAMFTTHPIEKPYLIYQIGSADPALAVQAAMTVLPDVAGIDLNCGCPKPFSTHAGMGAALLTNPDLLCSILTALRAALPKEVSLSAKIRLLPDSADTLKLVERIVGCGVNAITVHCRTRNMRPREKALVERLREIVEFVEGLGKGVAVVENGDCANWGDAMRIREITGAHSVMIATAAESNPTIFSPTPFVDLERTFTPSYLRLSHYLHNHFSLTKFCVSQFKSTHEALAKAEIKKFRDTLNQAKSWDGLEELAGGWDHDWRELEEIRTVVETREDTARMVFVPMELVEPEPKDRMEDIDEEHNSLFKTPTDRANPEPPTSRAPLGPSNERMYFIPAGISGRDATTPSPSGPRVRITRNQKMKLDKFESCGLFEC